MSKPLSGMRIIDLTHMLAGPFATNQLHLMGAEVVKIEPVGRGDAVRWEKSGPRFGMAPNFVAINSGKKSVAVDLKTARGREIVMKIGKTADALVENFRPGTMAQFGLDYEALAAVNPTIVYCAISGYGQEGAHRTRPAYDHVVQAITGMAGMNGDPDREGPIKVGFPAVDTATGMSASMAIVAALLRRERTGKGQFIDISMLDSTALLMYTMVTSYLATGNEPPRTGNRGFTGSPGCDTFGTANGFVAVGANTPAQFRRLCHALGVPEIARDNSLVDAAMVNGSNQGFARASDPAALRSRLAAAFAARTASEWEDILNRADVPAARVRSVGQFTDEILAAMEGSVLEIPAMPGHPQGARTLNAGFRTRFDSPGTESPAPLLGQHTEDVLKALGYPDDEIAALVEQGVVETQSAEEPSHGV